MAVRIRKLAQQVRRSPAEVLGVLHALGFPRYRSPDDMISGPVEAKLRQGLEDGVAPLPVHVPEVPRAVVEAPVQAAPRGSDLMASLVPGVTPQGARAAAPRRAPPPTATATPRTEPAGRPSPVVPEAPASGAPPRPTLPPPEAMPLDAEGAHRALALERAALDSERRILASERAVLEAERRVLEDLRFRLDGRTRALDAEREALAQLQAALERERAAFDAERRSAGDTGAMVATAPAGTSLLDLLEARGLRGADEFERALVALARGRHLREVLWALQVHPVDVLRSVLDEQLLLTSGPVPDQVGRGAAVVQVAPERADVPGGDALDRALEDLAGSMLLHGHRRLLVVGGPPRWQRLLREGMDRRMEVRVVPGGPRTASQATDDVAWADLLVVWEVAGRPEVDAIYAAAKAPVVRPRGLALRDLLDAVTDALLAA